MDLEDNNPFCLPQDPVSEPRADDKPEIYGIEITDAGKSREGTQRGHITYTIRTGNGATVRRRYSEFESLRRMLRRLFPCVIVPPIPEKHSIAAYAASPAHAHEDAKIIDHRRRMLAVFLNRCAAYPPIRDSEIFTRFLDPNSSWAEVLASESLARVPKSPLQAPPLDPANATPAHAHLPIPPSGARLRQDADPEFRAAEARAKEYEAFIGGGLEKSTRRMISRYSSLAADCADLGGQFNAFSLESACAVAPAVEKVGQAVDTGYLSAESLVDALNVQLSEPLAESAQVAATARAVLKYRRYRAVQVDMAAEALASRRKSLAKLEKEETEAQRINQHLHADERIARAMGETTPTQALSPPPSQPSASASADDIEDFADVASLDSVGTVGTAGATSGAPLGEAVNQATGGRFRLPGFSSINHALHGMMDVDPETARRNNISRTQLQIKNLEAALAVAKEDASTASTAVKDELDRYSKIKEQDLAKIVKAFVRCHIEWAEKNLQAWQEAKQVIAE